MSFWNVYSSCVCSVKLTYALQLYFSLPGLEVVEGSDVLKILGVLVDKHAVLGVS